MSGRCSGWFVGVALLAVGARAQASEEIRPGMALPATTAEAAKYEALLQGQAVAPGDDTVEKRRQFTEHRLSVGLGLALVRFTPLASVVLELSPWDRLALGADAGISFWGLAAGAHLRLRPIVWGGQGRSALHAVTVQGSYRYMHFGEEWTDGILSQMCHANCDEPNYLTAPAHFAGFELGFEHALSSGWTLRSGMGISYLLQQPAWRCQVWHEPEPCGEASPPNSAQLVTSFVVSHALF